MIDCTGRRGGRQTERNIMTNSSEQFADRESKLILEAYKIYKPDLFEGVGSLFVFLSAGTFTLSELNAIWLREIPRDDVPIGWGWSTGIVNITPGKNDNKRMFEDRRLRIFDYCECQWGDLLANGDIIMPGEHDLIVAEDLLKLGAVIEYERGF